MTTAELYEVETIVLKQAAKRNTERFPAHFMFHFDKSEWESLRTQIVILETGWGRHSKYLPLVFTEQGLAMLWGILNSAKAIDENIPHESLCIYNTI